MLEWGEVIAIAGTPGKAIGEGVDHKVVGKEYSAQYISGSVDTALSVPRAAPDTFLQSLDEGSVGLVHIKGVDDVVRIQVELGIVSRVIVTSTDMLNVGRNRSMEIWVCISEVANMCCGSSTGCRVESACENKSKETKDKFIDHILMHSVGAPFCPEVYTVVGSAISPVPVPDGIAESCKNRGSVVELGVCTDRKNIPVTWERVALWEKFVVLYKVIDIVVNMLSGELCDIVSCLNVEEGIKNEAVYGLN